MSIRDIAKRSAPKLVTLTLVVVAAAAMYLLFTRYSDRPWTRDGQVRADFIKIAPRVHGYLTQVAVKDNQFVRKGDLLFEVDPSDYQLAVDMAQVTLDQAREIVEALEAEVRAAEAVVGERQAGVTSAEGAVEAAQAGIKAAQAIVAESETGIVAARALITESEALVEEAGREAERAQRLADQRAGSIEIAQIKAAVLTASKAQLDSAHAGLTRAQAAVARTKAGETEAHARLVIAQNGLVEAQTAVITSSANLDRVKADLGEPGEANVRIRRANVALDEAKLNLSRTKIYAPGDGYITNMDLLAGTLVTPGIPFALFVDGSSFRVDGFFEETKLKRIRPGDRAIITLMGHHEQRLEGEVESIGYAVNPPRTAATEGPLNLVPTISPTFEWIRLAQRVPVRIRLTEIPEDIRLFSGMTASISIQK